jgi:cell division protein FtsI (penicillin-binding protein 3)
VHRIVTRMGPLLGIPPIDENAPEIRRALMIDSSAPPQEKRVASQ